MTASAMSQCCALRGMFVILSVFICTFAQVSAGVQPPGGSDEPFLIALRRELYPVRRNGQVISYKASYSGAIHVGYPQPQEFRVIFDTGSGHVVLPSVQCHSDTCRRHRRYDPSASQVAQALNLDGLPVPRGHAADQVTIGFGTGLITGKFAREQVCLGPAPQPAEEASGALPGRPCVESHIVMAVEMSKRPFELFDFDGILGLGLHSLALHKNFSFFDLLAGSGRVGLPQFGVFLTEGDDGEESEIAFGGHNPARLAGPLSWVPMAKPELGYWQVEVLSVSVGGQRLDVCDGGGCFGILDSGTSHLGFPASHTPAVSELLTRPASGVEDCRLVDAPVVEIELRGVTLRLHPNTYMRRLPLAEDDRAEMNAAMWPTSFLGTTTPPPSAGSQADSRSCTPKLLSVNLPALGPKAFILGEPVLHRYYTVFDWANLQAGFGVAAHHSGPQPPQPVLNV